MFETKSAQKVETIIELNEDILKFCEWLYHTYGPVYGADDELSAILQDICERKPIINPYRCYDTDPEYLRIIYKED